MDLWGIDYEKIYSNITLFIGALIVCGTNKASLYDGDLGETLYLQQKPISIIYHSVDGGRTWMSFDNSLPFDATVSSFVAINNEIFAATDNHGIYLITDGERAWKRIDEDLPKDVDINAFSLVGDSFVIGTLKHGIMLSKNRGKNWHYPKIPTNNTPIRCLHSKKDYRIQLPLQRLRRPKAD